MLIYDIILRLNSIPLNQTRTENLRLVYCKHILQSLHTTQIYLYLNGKHCTHAMVFRYSKAAKMACVL